MEIRTLKSFLAVAKLKNFSAAARELNTVQPAISRHISELEEELGVSLFWRNTREVKITAAGESLILDATDLLEKEHLAKSRAKRSATGELGELKIGYLSSASMTFLPEIVCRYSEAYPEVRVSLYEMTVKEQIDGLLSKTIDIGITRPMPLNMKDDFINQTIYEDSLMVVIPQNHRLAENKKINVSDLQQEEFILFKRNEAPALFDQIISLCNEYGFNPNIRSQPRNMQTVLLEVASGLGISISPGCTRYLNSKGCMFVKIHDRNLKIPTVIQYCRTAQRPTIQAFSELIFASQMEIRSKLEI